MHLGAVNSAAAAITAYAFDELLPTFSLIGADFVQPAPFTTARTSTRGSQPPCTRSTAMSQCWPVPTLYSRSSVRRVPPDRWAGPEPTSRDR